MTHDIKRMLELAAKAAGYKVVGDRHAGDGLNVLVGGRVWVWRPHADDGDALRLAVTLGIEFRKPSRARSVGRVVKAWFSPDGDPAKSATDHVSVLVDGDKFAATRLAVLMAAAAVGEVMP